MKKQLCAGLMAVLMILSPMSAYAAENETVQTESIAEENVRETQEQATIVETEDEIKAESETEIETQTEIETEIETEAQAETETKTEAETKNESEHLLPEDESDVQIESVDISDKINRLGGLSTTYFPANDVQVMSDTLVSQMRVRIENAFYNCDGHIDVKDLGVSLNNLDELVDAIVQVHNLDYRYFCYAGEFRYSYNRNSLIIQDIWMVYTSDYALPGYDTLGDSKKIENAIAKLVKVINDVVAGIDSSMTDVERILEVHDFLVRECDYDYENYLNNTLPSYTGTIEGVLIKKKAVCQGYAEAFAIIMNHLGYDTYIVTSWEMNHAWNLIRVGDNWYHVDCTWDDPIFNGNTFYWNVNNDYADEGHVGHTYFLKSDSEFKSLDHTSWEGNVPAATASGTYKNYCFYNKDRSMNYIDGYWYYIDDRNGAYYPGNNIIKTTLKKGYVEEIPLGVSAYQAHRNGKWIYYSLKNKIECLDVKTGEKRTSFDGMKYPGYEIHEFVIRENIAYLVLYNPNTRQFKKASYDLSSDNQQIVPTRLILSDTALTLSKKGEYKQLSYKILPSNATLKNVVWKSSNANIVSVNKNGVVTAKSFGKAKITAQVQGTNLKAECIVTSNADAVEAFVKRLYTEILGRDADASGLKAWADVLKSGKEQGAKVAQGFVESTEFKNRNLSDKDYIKALYRTFLNREADGGGLASWQEVLDDGLSRMHVFKGFAESPEFTKICQEYGIIRGNAHLTAPMDQNEGVTKFIARCYKLCLGRKGDEAGMNAWCNQLLTHKNTAKQAAHGFIFSKEFEKKKLSDREYVKILYRVFMDREADPAGLNSWIDVLKKGRSREHVFNGFADSSEFRKICASYGIR